MRLPYITPDRDWVMLALVSLATATAAVTLAVSGDRFNADFIWAMSFIVGLAAYGAWTVPAAWRSWRSGRRHRAAALQKVG